MKRILIGDSRDELLSTLEVILKNWGYRALATSDADEFLSLLDELTPDFNHCRPDTPDPEILGKAGSKPEVTATVD